MKAGAEKILALGAKAVLVKGGHLLREDSVTDVFFYKGELTLFEDRRIFTENTHGTGCTLSAAITAELAAGIPLEEAVRRGRQYLRMGLEASFRPGKGWGPLGHAVTPPWLRS